jgi:virginiamycin B lyase
MYPRFPARRSARGLLGLFLASALAWAATAKPAAQDLGGRVVDAAGAAVPGVFVTLTRTGTPASHTVMTGPDGRWELGGMPAGTWTLIAHGPGFVTASTELMAGDTPPAELRLESRDVSITDLPASVFLSFLPAGEEKRRFILDCTGCHVFNETTAMSGGELRSHAGWAEAVSRMLGMAGPNSNFPVISIGREPESTAAFLTESLQALDPEHTAFAVHREPNAAAANTIITEYAIPEPMDLPHDLAVQADGSVVITGMFTHRVYVLDPEAATFGTVPIPVANANPRAVEIDDAGRWWVLLGGPQRVARYDPATMAWDSWAIGMYPHSIGITDSGSVWFNGHFTRLPELIGRLDPDGSITTDTVPAHPRAANGFGPIPYELRMGPDGRVWVSELAGNRVFAYDPARDDYRVWDMPTPFAGPRRIDVGADGIVWIPEYANSALARLDPANGRIEEIALPIPDAAPYIARVDGRTGHVWIATGSADAVLRFDPATRSFDTFPLPTRGALIRHMDIDERNGDVWLAYGASPGIPSKVARLRPAH